MSMQIFILHTYEIWFCIPASRPTYLDLFGKGSTEHHSPADAFWWHCVLFHNTSDLWLKTHVQHAISLIHNQVAASTFNN